MMQLFIIFYIFSPPTHFSPKFVNHPKSGYFYTFRPQKCKYVTLL
jgi:hypothetical protein